ncbi:MAG: PIN domain-containing protein [Thermoprotei archaeon]|nr:PIN domain-containing protein [Thermoprotei archaeon]
MIRSGNVIVRDYIAFWHKLNDALEQYGIRIATPTPLHLATAHKLREQYGLTYFDSLHATIALAGNLELVSFDKGAYSKIPNLKYRHPHDLT